MRLFNRIQRFDDGELLGDFAHVLTPPDTRGVNQYVRLAAALEGDLDSITGRARLIKDHHTVFAQQAIDQGRFPDVGATNHADTNAFAAGVGRDAGIAFGKRFKYHVHQGRNIAPVGSGNRPGVA